AHPESTTLSLHDALPILGAAGVPHRARHAGPLPRAVLPCWPCARRSAAGAVTGLLRLPGPGRLLHRRAVAGRRAAAGRRAGPVRSEEHTSELQSLAYLVC